MKQEENSEKEKILKYSQRKFFSEGFYKITIDEIARELSISKNTIYKYYPSKEELLKAAIFDLISNTSAKIDPIVNSDANAAEKLIRMLTILSETIVKFNERFLKDLQLHTPHIWREVDEKRKQLMYRNITIIIEQGKKEKYFIDLPTEIIMTVFLASIRSVVNPEFLLNINYSNNEVVLITFKILLRGIITQKGSKFINNLKLSG